MDNKGYLAIVKSANRYYPFSGNVSKDYRDFKEKNNVVAELFDISNDICEGVFENETILNLVDKLNERKKFNIQKELERICKMKISKVHHPDYSLHLRPADFKVRKFHF
jgi:hypothetical protein